MEVRINYIIDSIRNWFNINGKGCKAIIGISGGKDSTIVASLCSKAIGRENVIGVSMPDDGQDSKLANEICRYLGIQFIEFPIWPMVSCYNKIHLSEQAKMNIPPRVRMSVLYSIAQTFNGRVMNTSNLSEDWIGYSTRWGDSVGDLMVLSNYTATEVKEIGYNLDLPKEWVDKIPDDGLPGSKPDEEKFGFTYDVLDRYIKTGECEDIFIRKKIDDMHRKNLFKIKMPESIPYYELS